MTGEHTNTNSNENSVGSSQSSQTPRTYATFSSIPKQELILTGRVNNVWEGPTFQRWAEDLRENLILKHCTDEQSKIAQTRAQIHPTKGEYRHLLNSNPISLKIDNFEEFLETLQSLILPTETKNHFESFERILQFRWTDNETLSSSALALQLLVTDYFNQLKDLDQSFAINDKLINAISNSFLFAQIPSTLPLHRKAFIQNYDHTLSIPSQVKKMLQKSDGKLYTLTQMSEANINFVTKSGKFSKIKPQPQQRQAPLSAQRTTPQNHSPNQIPQHFHPIQNNPQQLCIHCEQTGHTNKICPFNAYCHSCYKGHIRGTTEQCKNSRLNLYKLDFHPRHAPITTQIKELIIKGLWNSNGIYRQEYQGVKPIPQQNTQTQPNYYPNQAYRITPRPLQKKNWNFKRQNFYNTYTISSEAREQTPPPYLNEISQDQYTTSTDSYFPDEQYSENYYDDQQLPPDYSQSHQDSDHTEDNENQNF